ncbi:hypothetical protein ACP4OV_002693 [Aristida adscensionis]
MVLYGIFCSKTRVARYSVGARAILEQRACSIIGHRASLCVTALQQDSIFQAYDALSAIFVIQDGSVSLKVDTQHLRGINFATNSTYQFIGEMLVGSEIM